MFKDAKTFSSFSVDDLTIAKDFYTSTLGMEVEETKQGLQIHVMGGNSIFVYQKPNHIPATFTILNFEVDDINQAVADLSTKGVKFEHYTDEMQTDEKGILRGLAAGEGPDIAWFKDPAGNFISVLQNK